MSSQLTLGDGADLLPADDRAVVLALDIGGTKVAAALVDPAGNIVIRFPDVPTPLGGDAIEGLLESHLSLVPASHRCVHIAISMAGFVSSDRSTVVLAPNLLLSDFPLGDRLSRRVGVSVTVENDVNAAAWGEYRFGAGQGATVMMLVMVGTGLGGGIVINGALLRGEHGFAAEIGHLRHVPDGRLCNCGNVGCWEQYVSSHALRRDQNEEYAGNAADERQAEIYEVLGSHLGLGLADLVMLLDPTVLILSGGISRAHDSFEEQMYASLRSRTGSARPLPHIAVSDLGALAALRGVADLAMTGVPR